MSGSGSIRKRSGGCTGMLVGERVAAAGRMGPDPVRCGVVEDGRDPQRFEHRGQCRILRQAEGFGTTEAIDGITVVGKQGDQLAGKVQLPLLQPEKGSLQFEFVASRHRYGTSTDQGFAFCARENDGRQAAAALDAGVAEDQSAVGEAVGHAARQRT